MFRQIIAEAGSLVAQSSQARPQPRAWRTHKARKAEIIAIVSMEISFGIVLLVHLKLWITALIGVILLASAIYVGARPKAEGRKALRAPSTPG